MAIQNRRGNYSDFDPEKMVPGEWATVLSGDPNASDGKSIYHCFSAGNVKRMATYEDMEDNINKATDDIRNEFLEDINNATQSANTAASSANQAAQTAQQAAQDAQNAAESIEGAVEGTIINDQTPSNVTAFSGKYVDDTFLKKTGDATNTTVKFAPPNEEQDLASGETSGTLFGKIVKKLSVIKAAIGTLSSLTTTNKSSLVGAVNELNSALADIVTPKAFSDWGLTNPGNQNTRFTNAEAKNIDELIFVLQGTHNDEVAYEYVHIKTPFQMMQDAYYWANTTAGKLEIYYSSTSGMVDVRQLPLALRQILYVKY